MLPPARTVKQSYRPFVSAASTCLTAACEIPNCRAIADGLTPATKAARTAFALAAVNTLPLDALPGRGGAFLAVFPALAILSTRVALSIGSGALAVLASGGNRHRRFASSLTAASRVSISPSSSHLRAPGRSFGNM